MRDVLWKKCATHLVSLINSADQRGTGAAPYDCGNIYIHVAHLYADAQPHQVLYRHEIFGNGLVFALDFAHKVPLTRRTLAVHGCFPSHETCRYVFDASASVSNHPAVFFPSQPKPKDKYRRTDGAPAQWCGSYGATTGDNGCDRTVYKCPERNHDLRGVAAHAN